MLEEHEYKEVIKFLKKYYLDYSVFLIKYRIKYNHHTLSQRCAYENVKICNIYYILKECINDEILINDYIKNIEEYKCKERYRKLFNKLKLIINVGRRV